VIIFVWKTRQAGASGSTAAETEATPQLEIFGGFYMEYFKSFFVSFFSKKESTFFFGHAEGVLLARQKKQKTFTHWL